MKWDIWCEGDVMFAGLAVQVCRGPRCRLAPVSGPRCRWRDLHIGPEEERALSPWSGAMVRLV